MTPFVTRSGDAMRLGRATGFVAAAYAYAVAMLGTTLPTPLYPSYQAQWGFPT
jgi:hypothetical protein